VPQPLDRTVGFAGDGNEEVQSESRSVASHCAARPRASSAPLSASPISRLRRGDGHGVPYVHWEGYRPNVRRNSGNRSRGRDAAAAPGS
jgi:hypothetical protein